MVHQQPSPDVSRGLRVTIVGMVANAFLIFFKLWAGILSGSQALVADGIHSISDLFSDCVVILGLKWGRKEPDEDHPYGHARIETISSLIVGIILILVGVGIAYNAVRSLVLHKTAQLGGLALFAAGVSIVIKEALYWYTVSVGRHLKSPALIANAWHHRSDALSSVAVLLGVGAAYLNPAWHGADAYAALVVTLFVGRVGGALVWSAFRELSDVAPDKATITDIFTYALCTEGVRQVHDLKARFSGSQIFVELHIVVDPDISVREGHDIARNVRRGLLRDHPDVTRVIVHVDPELKME